MDCFDEHEEEKELQEGKRNEKMDQGCILDCTMLPLTNVGRKRCSEDENPGSVDGL